MQLKEFFTTEGDGERAVSPVIGVILMVAITVILAAVIATFVLGIGDSTEATPTTQFTFDYENNTNAVGYGNVTITHDGGDSIPVERLSFAGAASIDDVSNDTLADLYDPLVSSGDVISGDSARINATSGQTLRVVWASEGGDSSQTLATYEVPES